MTQKTQISGDRMDYYLQTGRRMHGEAIVMALRSVGRMLTRSVIGAVSRRGRHYHAAA
jgi:hypothetical protein